MYSIQISLDAKTVAECVRWHAGRAGDDLNRGSQSCPPSRRCKRNMPRSFCKRNTPMASMPRRAPRYGKSRSSKRMWTAAGERKGAVDRAGTRVMIGEAAFRSDGRTHSRAPQARRNRDNTPPRMRIPKVPPHRRRRDRSAAPAGRVPRRPR